MGPSARSERRAAIECVKVQLRPLDAGGGLIPVEAMSGVLRELGMPQGQVDQVFEAAAAAPNVVVGGGLWVDYEAFVDWLAGDVSDGATCGPEDPRLSGVLRAKRTSLAGRNIGASGTPTSLSKELSHFFSFREAQGASRLVPPEAQARMRDVWSAALAATTDGGLGAVMARRAEPDLRLWTDFARYCIDCLLQAAFGLFDTDADGRLSAQDLMTLLMLLTVHSEARWRMTPSDAEEIVQEFDTGSDGALNLSEFMTMAKCLEREARDYVLGPPKGGGRRSVSHQTWKPAHLVLYFDVNNTVLVADSITVSSAEDLICTTLAGNTWGVSALRRSGEEVWVQVCPEPSVNQPWQGLVSYTEFVVKHNPLPQDGKKEEIDKVADRRRALLRAFCREGGPGAAMWPHVERLRDKLAENPCKLLPSFYFLLKDLKQQGRSFSVVFRTFGIDMDSSVQSEFNAFCEGRHPLFPDAKLDGSDGLEDYRMDIADADSTGTFVRCGTGDGDVALVWGTRQQPKGSQGLEMYDAIPEARIVRGIADAAKSLQERVAGSSRTVVLRDHYDAWSRAKFAGCGGKPLFVQVEDRSIFPVFFDDHARPVDPNIIDAIDVRTYPQRLPMVQVYDIHLVRAAPLRSITELRYFRDELDRCEIAKAAQLKRRRQVGTMLHDAAALRGVLCLIGGPEPSAPGTPVPTTVHGMPNDPAMNYTRWQDLEVVKHSTPFVGIS